jgi:deoxyribodipyrimidine photo-lyase
MDKETVDMSLLDSGQRPVVSLASFTPTRTHALQTLAQFAPRAGNAYTAGRNSDHGPDAPTAVSRLSPYVRHRMITEQEIVAHVLARHNFVAAEKYVQEVLWRTYWKGWLEMRPGIWTRFLAARDQARENFPNARAITAAEAGMTGVEGFDDWARELVETGYLHNHARMWFASIWIFTLRLPWALGADFFLRHLLDADAASNTLSWRWVAGLQTAGKTYLATADNIARYTNGRFSPKGLAREAVALTEAPIDSPRFLPELALADSKQPSLLLVTHDDLHPESVIASATAINSAVIVADENLAWGTASQQFVSAAAKDTAARATAHFGCDAIVAPTLDAADIVRATQAAQVRQIIHPYAPVGPVADVLARIAPVLASEGIKLVPARRDWDSHFWPYAKKGFFPFKEQIPKGLAQLGLT